MTNIKYFIYEKITDKTPKGHFRRYLNQEDPLVAAGELKKMAPNRLKLTENDY